MTARVKAAILGDSLFAGYPGASPADYMVNYFNNLEPNLLSVENMALSGSAAERFITGYGPSTPYFQWVRETDAELLLIRYGGIEALFDPSHNLMRSFRENIEMMIDLAHAVMKKVVLVGKINIPTSPGADQGFQDRYNRVQTILNHIVYRNGIEIINLHDIPAGPMLDEIHPAKAYQDLHNQRICDWLLAEYGQ